MNCTMRKANERQMTTRTNIARLEEMSGARRDGPNDDPNPHAIASFRWGAAFETSNTAARYTVSATALTGPDACTFFSSEPSRSMLFYRFRRIRSSMRLT
jgi:hypothetical protein